MNVNHWLIYTNNACLVVKRVTMRKGPQSLYVAVGQGKMQLLLISTLLQLKDKWSFQLATGSNLHYSELNMDFT